MADSIDITDLSLTARSAVALRCFSRYCAIRGLRHEEIDKFLNHLWEFPLVDQTTWDDWERNHPPLVFAAIGDGWPPGFESFLTAQGEDAAFFRCLLESVTEVIFCSFYVAADDKGSAEFLRQVMEATARFGVVPPPLECFANSRFQDRGGWGHRMTIEQRDAWRMAF